MSLPVPLALARGQVPLHVLPFILLLRPTQPGCSRPGTACQAEELSWEAGGRCFILVQTGGRGVPPVAASSALTAVLIHSPPVL